MENKVKPSVKRFFLLKRAVLWTALFACLFAGLLGGWFYKYTVTPGPDFTAESVVVVIPKGSSVEKIGNILGEAGLIHDDIRFRILTKYMDVTTQLRAGEFLLPTKQKPATIITTLVEAVPVQHSVTIPEGLRIEEIASIFAIDGWSDAEEFVRLSADRPFLESLGLGEMDTIEGYLFPDTYNLSLDDKNSKAIIKMMVKRFNEIWKVIGSEGLSVKEKQDVITLASIVEKETGVAQERAIIAGVFANRIKKKMRLQSDPTVVYGIKGFDGKITRKHLKAETEYNTYVIPALPPGPICNPGEDAIRAVLQPEEHKYLYFVSQNDGTHYFSKSLKEHNRAVYRYKQKLKAARKKKDSN